MSDELSVYPRMLFEPEAVTEVRGRDIGMGSTHFYWRDDVESTPVVGDIIELETIRFSQVTGAKVNGEWRFRDSDEDISRQDRERSERYDRDKREQLEARRDEWQSREDALPLWARCRMMRFHHYGGEKFRLQGWGYELVTCELAAMYADLPEMLAHDAPLPEHIAAFDESQGCSGNQHGCARLLATYVREGKEPLAVFTPAAFSPLTGSADYAGVK